MPVELAIFKFFNVTIASPILDRFFIYICDFKIWALPLALVLIAILWKGNAKSRWMILLAIIAIAVIDPVVYRVLKPLFGRLRPCHESALDWIRIVDGCGGRYGFPSNHAANFFGLAAVIGSFYKTTRYYLYPAALLVAIGRVYLGVHYPSDVIAGGLFGAVIGFLIVFIGKKAAPNKIGAIFRKSGI